MKPTRRQLLGTALAGSLAACSPSPKIQSFKASSDTASGLFAHGIASGDPLTDAVVIWTRLTPDNPNDGPVELTWEMDQSPNFKTVSASGKVTASAATNWTAKVDVRGLEPGRWYYYRFSVDIYTSPIGQTRTLPEGDINQARFAVVSCANWQHGFFNTYDHIARQNRKTRQFDALIHLGDYLYEYGADKIFGTDYAKMGRLHEPRHEIITLNDYRTRHAQYRTDPSLQALTAKMPMICIWDDHESSNDSWVTGAENHNENEGDWENRKAAALRAYYEWMPIREPQAGKPREAIFRKFEWGNLLTLVALETRLMARSESYIFDPYFEMISEPGGAEKFKTEILGDPARQMLGDAQLDFLIDSLTSSKEAGKPWRLVANQIPMAKINTPDLTPHVNEEAMLNIEKVWSGIREFVELSRHTLPMYPDAWDGYPAARNRLYARLKEADVTDMLVLTGDAHEFWANDLTDDNGTQMGVEIGTSSVSSETLAAFLKDASEDYGLLMTQSNPDVRYYNLLTQGYIELTVKPDRAEVKMIAIDNVITQEYGAFETAAFTIRPTKSTLKLSTPKGLNMKQRALFTGLG